MLKRLVAEVRLPVMLVDLDILNTGGDTLQGLMFFCAAEAALLHQEGFDDLLIAYPTVQTQDLEQLWDLRRSGANVSLMLDSPAHVHRLQTWCAVVSA